MLAKAAISALAILPTSGQCGSAFSQVGFIERNGSGFIVVSK